MEEFVLIPLYHHLELTSSVNDFNSTTADTSRFTTHQTQYPNAPNSEHDVIFEIQSKSSEAPPAAKQNGSKDLLNLYRNPKQRTNLKKFYKRHNMNCLSTEKESRG